MGDNSYVLEETDEQLERLMDEVIRSGARIELKREDKCAYLVSEDDVLALSALEEDFGGGWVDAAAHAFANIGL